jgi:pimeloyl-ACP methyl ester carboxylesterase
LEAKYARPPSQFVMLPDGARAHVRDRGPRSGHTIVLLHGSNASFLTWEPWAKRLEDTFRVVTVDLPGHGLTGAVPNTDYSQKGMTTFVGEVADVLGLQTFALGGNSMGGRIAAAYAADHPQRVTHLILVDASGLPYARSDRVSFAFRLLRTPVVNRILMHVAPRAIVVWGVREAVAHKDIITDAMIDSAWDFARMEGTREAMIARAAASSGGVRDRVDDITAPTLILWGEDDRLIPVGIAHQFRAVLPNAKKLVIYPETGHLPQEEVADQSAAEVRAFITEAPRTPQRSD